MLEGRKVKFKRYVSYQEGSEEFDGVFLTFGVNSDYNTDDMVGCTETTAIIEDEEGKVFNVRLNMFKFVGDSE